MQLFTDFLPIMIFFGAYKLADVYVATIALMIALVIQVGVHWLKHKTFNKMHLTTAIMVLVFGGATLIFRDEDFIKMKPTILYLLFAAGAFASNYIGDKPLIERLLSDNLQLPANIWRKLTLMWAGFFLVSGITNHIVATQFSTDAWFNFKMFGMLGMTIVFIIIQAVYISRYITPDEARASSPSDK